MTSSCVDDDNDVHDDEEEEEEEEEEGTGVGQCVLSWQWNSIYANIHITYHVFIPNP